MITEEQLADECRRLRDENLQLQQDYEQLSDLFNRMGLGYEDAVMLYDQAMESSRMKTDFIKQISHEIRTPLNILSGFAQILTSGMELDEAMRQEVTKGIADNTQRITGLVNKMLELADAGNDTPLERNDDALAIQIAAQAADESLVATASHLTFDLQFSPEAEMAMVHTNLQQATRALVLLLDNAKKFTAPPEAAGGSAAVQQKARVTLSVAIQSQPTGQMLVFTVEDTGIGIAPEQAEHIFDEFVQLNEYYDGTGIGLTVARSIARRLGGDIVLDTNYNEGARFVYTLPM